MRPLNCLLFIFLFCFLSIAHLSIASEFKLTPQNIKKIKCHVKKKQTVFEGLSVPYEPYNRNTNKTRLLDCQHVKLDTDEFYTSKFISFDEQSVKPSKVLTFEIAILDKKNKKLKTVRTEIIDRVLLDGDLPDEKFENILSVEWGRSTKDQQPMLKLHISGEDKTEKPFSYLIKLNKKNDWFEDVF